jgi:hypothetical protein
MFFISKLGEDSLVIYVQAFNLYPSTALSQRHPATVVQERGRLSAPGGPDEA